MRFAGVTGGIGDVLIGVLGFGVGGFSGLGLGIRGSGRVRLGVRGLGDSCRF